MIEEVVYPTCEIPVHLKWQILSFLRMEWPDGFTGPNRLRDWISREEDHSISFILVEKNILISHTEVVWKYLEHAGVTYKVYGLSGVFTYPALHKQGNGTQIVALVTAYIDKSDADLGIVFTRPHLQRFYARNGWLPMEKTVIQIGPKQNPVVSDKLVLTRFLSEKGKKGRTSFETGPVYFGENVW